MQSSHLRKSQWKIFAVGLLMVSTVLVALVSFLPAIGTSKIPPERAFYFWKTVWSNNEDVESMLAKSNVKKLYMRYFDVSWDRQSSRAKPVSPLESKDALPQSLEIIPVVYLTNEVFIKIPYADVEDLADKVWTKVSQMAKYQKVEVKELQLDSDWSQSSRKQYFHFLDLLRRRLNPLGIEVSATLRLHQIKYPDRTGIPPVDRGMLMFYNFGRILAEGERSSIFNKEDASLYTSYIAQYKMPLDISLPIFSWMVHSRDGKVLDLVDKMTESELLKDGSFEQIAPRKYLAKQSFFLRGRYFVKDDLLLIEETNPQITREAAELALKGAGSQKSYQTVAFFDIDEDIVKHYGEKEIENIFREF